MNVITPQDIDFDSYLRSHPDHARVIPAWAYRDLVVDHFYGEGRERGVLLPWSKTHNILKLRPGEVSVWAGFNGSGKSMLLSQIMLHAMKQGERVCIASMEMKPVSTLSRLYRQACGVSEPTIAYIDRVTEWLEEKLWLYDQQDTVKSDRIIALLRYCSEGVMSKGRKLPITSMVVDSLMKCGIAVDDYNRQKSFIDQLCAHAKDTGMHIHLVAHARKSDSEYKQVDKMDIKGASEITDQVDNVYTLWRNKAKEDEKQKGNNEKIINEPDAILSCSKNRHGDWEGKISLWYQRDSMQFHGKETTSSIHILEYSESEI